MPKHTQALNRKAKRILKQLDEQEQQEVIGLSVPIGCTTVFDPGWEVDFTGESLMFACQPMERDLYGCYGDCWWAAQVPDGLTNYPSWHEECPAAVRDWQKLRFIEE